MANDIRSRSHVTLGFLHDVDAGRLADAAALYTDTVRRLGIEEGDFWPHLALGLAKYDFPTEEAEAMNLPSVTGAASGVELQLEISVTEFRVLVDKPLV
ncbi:hypothetical protein ABTZ21_02810 [Streptomyces sp. NPDC096191]|uniref:hypothetical protein n=1 Tax=Streptomyces sp. NPDC096191 TaxID=3155426 RepID=UPI00332B9772